MTCTLRIPHHFDLYEVHIRPAETGHMIHRIVKYMGESQHAREVLFDSLPKEVIAEITKMFYAEEIKLNGLS